MVLAQNVCLAEYTNLGFIVSHKVPKHSFDYTGVYDFYMKLVAEYESLKADPLSSRHAINFAMTAWHLAEWVWAQRLKDNRQEQQELYGRTFKDQKSYIAHITSVCPDLEVVQTICNGSKHFTTGGRVSRTFRRDSFRRTAKRFLGVEIDNTEHDFANIAERTYEFWHSKITPPYAKIAKERGLFKRTQKQFTVRDPTKTIST